MNINSFARLLSICFMAVAAPCLARAETPNIYQATLGEKGSTPEVSTAEMTSLLNDRRVAIVDTRTRAEFDAGHMPGAVFLDAPAERHVQLVDKLAGGDRAKPLVLYCNGPFCQASRRLADRLVKSGFSNVRRYQLGIPVWRALGGPVAIEIDGVKRLAGHDQTAVFIDVRAASEFAIGSLAAARSAPLEDILSGKLKKFPLPEDDFNRRIVLLAGDAGEARKAAAQLSKRPWHNVSYFNGSYQSLQAALAAK